jgi:hypothetical protein
MQTITFASHVAYLDPMTGGGLLVRPKPADDLSLSMVSLHAADWDAAIAHLRGLGWEPAEDEDGDETPRFAGVTADGRDAILLRTDEPITSRPTPEECADADEELARVAGLTV